MADNEDGPTLPDESGARTGTDKSSSDEPWVRPGTAESREQFYDEVVGPALLDLQKRCNEKGLSLLAVAEWDPGETGRTVCVLPDTHLALRVALAALKAGGNVDTLILALMRHGQEHGHSSVCLSRLGVPYERREDTARSQATWPTAES